MKTLRFVKYHALGNDYLVFEPSGFPLPLDPAWIRWICDRRQGVGSDGILLGPLPASPAIPGAAIPGAANPGAANPGAVPYGLQIFNPDGSEAEKSGNGLRIFARYLWDTGRPGPSYEIVTPGGPARAVIDPASDRVQVEMGRASFDSQAIPVAGPPRLVLDETLEIGERRFRFGAVTLGNPHCVILGEEVSPVFAREWGPRLETHPLFPNRTNVQFLKVLDRKTLQIEIWERGAGYTLASGSSSCAAAALAHRLGLCGPQVQVRVPGGVLAVSIAPDETLTLTGPVRRVFSGEIEL